jgi:WD40 repeat protein
VLKPIGIIQGIFILTRIVTSVAFHPHGTVIATASTDRTIKLFDIRTHKLIQHYGDAHGPAPFAGQHLDGTANSSGAVNSVSFGGPNGEWLISTGMDGLVKVWDVQEGHLFYTLHGHKNGATTAAVFSPDGEFFASGGCDSQVMVWKSNFDKIEKSGLQDTQTGFSKIKKNESAKQKNTPIEDIRQQWSPKPRAPIGGLLQERRDQSPEMDPIQVGASVFSEVVIFY